MFLKLRGGGVGSHKFDADCGLCGLWRRPVVPGNHGHGELVWVERVDLPCRADVAGDWVHGEGVPGGRVQQVVPHLPRTAGVRVLGVYL